MVLNASSNQRFSFPHPYIIKISISPPTRYLPKRKKKTPSHIPIQQSKQKPTLLIHSFVLHCMAASISATGFSSSFHGSWGNSFCGEDASTLNKSLPNIVRVGRPIRLKPVMKNVNEGKGIFAPVVVVVRNIVGKKTFNQLRGKAIALHSQVITEFCKTIGADAKQRQGLIRLAKKNGEKLGFLA